MYVERVPVGPLQANCYIISSDLMEKAVVIDPGAEAEKIYNKLKEKDLELEYIILTHGHGDHIGGVRELKELTNAKVLIHKDDLPLVESAKKNFSLQMGMPVEFTPDKLVEDGEVITVDNLKLEIIHTPGHTPGGISIKVDNLLFTGDTLFANSIGRTDFPGGSYEIIIKSIKEKLFIYDDDTKVFPGHGPVTSIGIERLTNPFLI